MEPLVTEMRNSYTVHYLINRKAQKWILYAAGRLRLCILQQYIAFNFSLWTRSFLITSMSCFPISTLKPAWRQLSSEALLAANNPRLSIPFPSGMVPTCPSWPGWGRASSVLASQPAPFLHPHHNLVELKKPHKPKPTKQTTSNPSLFLLFPSRARMPVWLTSTIGSCFLAGLGGPCSSLALCSGPNSLI